MHYQLGVVCMQSAKLARAEAAFAAALQIDPAHRGALVNGAHVLGMFPPSDKAACARLRALARLGVAAGVWRYPLQRPPHLVPGLESRPWHDPASFPFTRQLRAQHATIKAEYLAPNPSPNPNPNPDPNPNPNPDPNPNPNPSPSPSPGPSPNPNPNPNYQG